jgi:hypothetical protein
LVRSRRHDDRAAVIRSYIIEHFFSRRFIGF